MDIHAEPPAWHKLVSEPVVTFPLQGTRLPGQADGAIIDAQAKDVPAKVEPPVVSADDTPLPDRRSWQRTGRPVMNAQRFEAGWPEDQQEEPETEPELERGGEDELDDDFIEDDEDIIFEDDDDPIL